MTDRTCPKLAHHWGPLDVCGSPHRYNYSADFFSKIRSHLSHVAQVTFKSYLSHFRGNGPPPPSQAVYISGVGFLPPSKMSPSKVGFLAIRIFKKSLGVLMEPPTPAWKKLLRNYANRSRFLSKNQTMPLHTLCFSCCLNDLTAAFFMYFELLSRRIKHEKGSSSIVKAKRKP